MANAPHGHIDGGKAGGHQLRKWSELFLPNPASTRNARYRQSRGEVNGDGEPCLHENKYRTK
jgi:hypothetical protein